MLSGGVQDLQQIFDDKAIDTVSIAIPNCWHAGRDPGH